MNSLIILTAIAVFVLVIIVRAVAAAEKLYTAANIPPVKIDVASAAEKLSAAVRIRTIACDEIGETDIKAFRDFAAYLKKSFPLVHSEMKREVINGASLLYRWKGKDKQKKPVLFCAHIDVVPVETGTEGDWKYPPFFGAIKDDSVWGRGTQDIKNQLIALLEAAEAMIAQKFTPERDIYFAFGHDEETRRHDGADVIAALLKDRGILFEYVLDEGGSVLDNAVTGVKRPVAFIGIAEKGFVNVHLEAKGGMGHSSMLLEHRAAGIICRTVSRLETHSCPLALTVPVKQMFSALAPVTRPGLRMVFSNMWFFAPLFKRIFALSPQGAALLRTTMAATMLSGSGAPNVLPQAASAVVNARILHGESSDTLKSYIGKVIADSSVSIEMHQVYEPSKISPVDSYGFMRTAGVIRALWPEAVIVPYLVAGGGDARKYEELTDCVYRFTPARVDNSEMKQIHGTNERVSLQNLEDSIKFYTAMFAG